jgi:predicted RecA/RadA family phage recombinase
MANIALVTANKVEVVSSHIQMTLPAAEAIVAGAAVRMDVSSGKFTNANGTLAAEARIYGVALKTVAAGEPVTAIRKGVMDGHALSGMAYDAAVYLSDTDGTLADAAGTVSTVVGRVIPGTATTLGTAFDKLLMVDL